MSIENPRIVAHEFLRPLYAEMYYPDHVLDRGVEILHRLCTRIEADRPNDPAALYVLTQDATEQFNRLQAEFEADGSEIDTIAREEIFEDFCFVAEAYGFADFDHEKLVANRDW